MNAESIVGRESERKELDRVLRSPRPELVVVFGRRRVGKTFLVRQHFRDKIVFEITGLHHENLQRQLENFSNRLRQATHQAPPTPKTWLSAFEQLKSFLTNNRTGQKQVIFFDEFPWLASQRSGFLSAFEEFWNGFAVQRSDLLCVVCGSAASWMIQNVLSSKGGLHNRATSRIRLMPFQLAETRAFLQRNRVDLPDFQIAQLQMVLGGIPHYLQHVEAGQSAAQVIDRLCFSKDGLLRDEFSNLYKALFDSPDKHEAVVLALAQARKGHTRNELAERTGIATGGTLTKILSELEESGFIVEIPSLFFEKKNSLWRLADAYSHFYLQWMASRRKSSRLSWLNIATGNKWKSWCGYAFENLCFAHVKQIKQSLGISGVVTEEASWQYHAKTMSECGAQIDLLIDRADNAINLCELKFSDYPFVIDKKYAAELEQKIQVFKQRTKTRKALFLTLVTASGLEQNSYATSLVTNHIQLNQLF
jgi:AAA+ ATPase superfamily predicted ATPase